MGRSYSNPRAFKDALEARIKRRAKEQGVAMNRLRQLVLFERFLQRIYDACGDAIIVKGGFVLELRLARARTTKDIDLRVEGELDDLIEQIIEASRQAGDDYLSFGFSGERDFQEILGDQVVYDGRRLQVRARLGGRPYGDPFRLDMSVADRLVLPPDRVVGTDLMEFVGITPVEHSVYPEEAHIAEKLHAYAMPRDGKPNSRTKDLVDIGLLARHTNFDADELYRSIVATFEFRDTNPVPTELQEPPPGWTKRFEKMRKRDDLEWENIDALFELCRAFLDPVLKGNEDGKVWSPEDRNWGEK
jgi:hypothetical protein